MRSIDDNADSNPIQEYTSSPKPKQSCCDHTEQVTSNRTLHSPKNPFFIPFVLILIFAVVEFYTGVWSQSLALLSDAWHMLSDVFAIGLAMTAFYVTTSAAHKQKGRGTSQVELLASVVNALLMFAVIAWIVVEAWHRYAAPASVQSVPVIVVATLGLLINLYVAKHLHQQHAEHDECSHSHHGLNHQAAFLHVLGDILGSVAALVSGVVIYFSGWTLIDPILSLVIAALLFVSTLGLCHKIYKALSQR